MAACSSVRKRERVLPPMAGVRLWYGPWRAWGSPAQAQPGLPHRIAPTIGWTLANGTALKVSPGFGVSGTSAGFLLRLGVSCEIDQFGRMAGHLFRGVGGGQ